MQPFDKCPICGGELTTKLVDKLLRDGDHAATLRVEAEVCHRCGERLYTPETVQRFEEIRERLEKRDTADFDLIGSCFRVA